MRHLWELIRDFVKVPLGLKIWNRVRRVKMFHGIKTLVVPLLEDSLLKHSGNKVTFLSSL